MPKKIITHNGNFHADDVMAVATLQLLLKKRGEPRAQVIRTRDEAMFKTGDFVVDVGGVHDESIDRFDHHQQGGGGARENGIPYAAFGLVWKKYGEEVVGDVNIGNSGVSAINAAAKAAAAYLDEKLVQSIDANDNGFPIIELKIPHAEPYLFDSFVYSYYPTWKELIEIRTKKSDAAKSAPTDNIIKNDTAESNIFDQRFEQVVPIAEGLLEREIAMARSREEARALVIKCYESAADKRIIVLDEKYSWRDTIKKFPEPLFVAIPIYDLARWYVYAVPQGDRLAFKNRKKLPASWAGKRDQELVDASGVADAIFCHRGLYLVVAGSREGALQLAEKAVAATK